MKVLRNNAHSCCNGFNSLNNEGYLTVAHMMKYFYPLYKTYGDIRHRNPRHYKLMKFLNNQIIPFGFKK